MQDCPEPESAHRSRTSASGGWRPWWAVLAWIAVLLPTIWLRPPVNHFWGFDEQVYAVVGDGLNHGLAPYRDLWDNKGLAWYALFALILRFLGHQASSINATVILLVAVIQVLIYRVVRQIPLSRLVAFGAAGIFGLASVMCGRELNSEIGVLVGSIAGFWLALIGAQRTNMWAWLGAGLMVGLGASCKVVGALDLAGLLVLATLWPAAINPHWNWRLMHRFLPCLLGVAIVPAVSALWCALHDALGPMIELVLGFTTAQAGVVPINLDFVGQVFRWCWHLTTLSPHLWLPALVGLVVAIQLVRQSAASSPAQRTNRAVMGALLVWTGAGLTGALAGRRFGPGYYHYWWQLYAPLAVLAAVGLEHIWRKWATQLQWRRAAVLLVFALLLLVGLRPTNPKGRIADWATILAHQESPMPYQLVGQYVAAHSGPTDHIFVWARSPAVYFFAQRLPATPYIFCLPLTALYSGTARPYDAHQDWRRWATDFDAHKPLYVVDGSEPESAGPAWQLAHHPPLVERISNYELETIIAGYRILRRKDSGR